MTAMSDKIDDRMKTGVDIVHEDNTADRKTIWIWIKNVGTSRITGFQETDVFFGPEGNFVRVPHEDTPGASYPIWAYTNENDPADEDEWNIGETLKITVTYDTAPSAGTYFIKIVIPNGVAAEYYFSM
jgi:archaellum component FlaG (FlaF/FlaG flagellin family)